MTSEETSKCGSLSKTNVCILKVFAKVFLSLTNLAFNEMVHIWGTVIKKIPTIPIIFCDRYQV